MGTLMADEAARCMQDPNARDPRDEVNQVRFTDRQWEARFLSRKCQIHISERMGDIHHCTT